MVSDFRSPVSFFFGMSERITSSCVGSLTSFIEIGRVTTGTQCP